LGKLEGIPLVSCIDDVARGLSARKKWVLYSSSRQLPLEKGKEKEKEKEKVRKLEGIPLVV
jgi:hypothetical protein